jgi:hypothetical protein
LEAFHEELIFHHTVSILSCSLVLAVCQSPRTEPEDIALDPLRSMMQAGRSIRVERRRNDTGDSTMKKLIATLASAALLTAAGIALANSSADLALDPNRMFFQYWAPGVDSGDFQVMPGNVHNPIVLPCEVTSFGGQLDIDYLGAGPTVYPQFTVTFFDDQDQPITSQGCQGNIHVSSLVVSVNPFSPGAAQAAGYIPVSSTNQFCAWMFQPKDLPADKVVRMHHELVGYDNSSYQGPTLLDPDLSNNVRDVYVRRACSCP